MEGDQSVEVLAWIDRDVALSVAPGMRAVIELASADGGRVALGGEIATIASVPLNEQLAAFELTAPSRPVESGSGWTKRWILQVPAGTECRIAIELGRQSPLALFGLRRP